MVSLKPEPIPLDLKVLIVGNDAIYQSLLAMDSDFRKLFKIKVEFEEDAPLNEENMNKLARFIHGFCEKEELPHLDKSAVAKIIEYASKISGDRDKISTRFTDIAQIVGEAATSSEGTGLFLPANTKNQNYDAAFKFASWVAGPEGQAILAKGNRLVPNQTSYGMGEYAESADRIVPNMWAGSYLAQKADIGDYTYFTSLTWITEWSMTFNSDVREGLMTLSDFIAQKKEVADTGLKGMNIRMNGR